MPVLFIVSGSPGRVTFASTVSKNVLADFEFFNDSVFDSSKYDECHDWMLDRAEYFMATGEDLAIANDNITPNDFVTIAEKYGYDVYMVKLYPKPSIKSKVKLRLI